jgi:hypothetical protein
MRSTIRKNGLEEGGRGRGREGRAEREKRRGGGNGGLRKGSEELERGW